MLLIKEVSECLGRGAMSNPFLVALVTGLLLSTSTPAQDIGVAPAALSLELYLVDERDACKPEGYRTYGTVENEPRRPNCVVLTGEALEDWEIVKDVNYVQLSIPPPTLALDGTMLTILGDYVREVGTASWQKSSNRLAVVFVFRLAGANEVPIEFARAGSEDGIIPPRVVVGSGGDDNRWIDHQRADALHPDHRVVWTLRVGTGAASKTWKIRTY